MMGHRKWDREVWQSTCYDSFLDEHNALYEAWRAAEHRVMETLDENNRLDRELDEARKRIAELESPLRVPFSDAQIERMARASHNEWYQEHSDAEWNAESDKKRGEWCDVVRAALAAVGPQYCPADVAFNSRVPELEKKIDNQRMSLRQLHELRERERAERNILERELKDMKADRDALRADLAAAEIELADKSFYVREFAAVSAERDALKKRNDIQAEQLIRIDSEISPLMSEVAELKAERDAIAHIRKRPDGLPTPDQFNAHFARIDRGLFEHDVIELIYDYLTPFLRDPVGWEPITLEEYTDMRNRFTRGYDWEQQLAKEYDWLRSRIKPVFECKECAYKQTRIHRLEGWVGALEGYCDDMRKLAAQLPARAALEGE